MLIAELPPVAVDRDELGRALARLVVVADRLLDETAPAIADRGRLPDWSGRVSRNPLLMDRYRAEVESGMPDWPVRRSGRTDDGRAAGAAGDGRGHRGSDRLGGGWGPRAGVRSRVHDDHPTRATVVDDAASKVIVTVDIAFTNTFAPPAGQTSVFNTILVAIHDHAAAVTAGDGSGALNVSVATSGGVNVATITPRAPVAVRQHGDPVPGLRAARR